MANRSIDILGIENAILDILVKVPETLIGQLGLDKGIMKLVDPVEQKQILDTVGQLNPFITPGGSCANVLRGAATLGAHCSYSSAVGPDTYGTAFQKGLTDAGVTNQCQELAGVTGTSVILVTPDGERTMNTHLGVCREYARANVPDQDIAQSQIFFTTGYMWDTPNQIEAIETAIKLAREAGSSLAIDLADPFAVGRSREHLDRHLEQGVDILFANPEEAKMMTGLEDCQQSAADLGKTCGIAVVKDGPRGCWIAHEGNVHLIPTTPVEVVDTTGAGDCFAAGFLYGLVDKQPIEVCGKIANTLAADNIQHLGVRLTEGIADQVAAIKEEAAPGS